MKLGVVEAAFMNNMVRKWFLRNLEARIFFRFLIRNRMIKEWPISFLEIGCGRGDAIPIHEVYYQPKYYNAFDLDPILIKNALAKTKVLNPSHIRISVADVRFIDEPDGRFDIIVGYGVLHHVYGWQKGLKEISRVLKLGGIYCWEEPFEYFNHLFISKLLLSHPEVNMTYKNWMNELEKVSLRCIFGWPFKNPFITLGVSIKV